MILSESYDGFVARRKARELAGSWFDTEVLKRHLLVAKLNKVGGNKNSSEYTSYLINIAAKVMSSSMHACFCIQPGIVNQDRDFSLLIVTMCVSMSP